EALGELSVGDHQRRKDPDDVVKRARSDGDEAVLVAELGDFLRLGVSRLAGLYVADEFHRTHAAETADFADERPFFLPGARTIFKAFADGSGASQQVLLFNRFDDGERGGAT